MAEDVAAIARIDAVPKILEVVCRSTGMGFAAVARVTDERWVACAVRDEIDFGLKPGGELKIETTLCNEIRRSGQPVVIDNVAEDTVYSGHPTPAMYGFKSYISLPILRKDGSFFGTLCAIDPNPARVNTPQTVGMFRLFADLIGLHLDTQDRLEANEAALTDARATASLREEFIAVLGHDLRNPLASLDAGTQVLHRLPMDPKVAPVLTVMQNSVRRMAGLIDDVMDFARARLGGGLPCSLKDEDQLAPALEQVIAELRGAWSARTIESQIAIAGKVYCDRARIAQLLSNLLANALAHGAPDAPIKVEASCDGDAFELSVSNQGKPIPPTTIGRLFQPFTRASEAPSQQGLGLGLYIASQIASSSRHAGRGLDRG